LLSEYDVGCGGEGGVVGVGGGGGGGGGRVWNTYLKKNAYSLHHLLPVFR